MTRLSLHIGLNRVDPRKYGGWDGALSGCVNDANAMHDVAVGRGFTPTVLLDEDATVANVRAQLSAAAEQLGENDFYLLTYSGHGGQVPDTDNEETDRLDETWCLYDTELVDDALYGALCSFAAGVRIVVMSDSCHSQTVTREPLILRRDDDARALGPAAKRAPLAVTKAEYAAHQDAYDDQRKWWKPNKTPADAQARVVLLSGCQDNQTSLDGPKNGAFTGAFLQVWADGAYRGDYQQLVTKLRGALTRQTPCLFSYGVDVDQLVEQQAFAD